MSGVLLGDTDIVALRQPGDLARLYPLAPCRNRQPAAKRHRVAGVQGKVEKSQFELVGIDSNWRHSVLEFGGDLDIRPERAPQHLEHAVDQRGNVERLRGFSSCRRAKASMRWVSVAPRSAPWIAPSIRRASLGSSRNILPQDLEIAENRHQQIVEIMRDAARQLARGFRASASRAAAPVPASRSRVRSSTRRSRSRIGLCQLGGALGDPVFELRIELLELAGFAVELGEHPDLGAQQIGDDRHRDVIDRSRRHSRASRSRSVTWIAETKMMAVF